MDARVRHRRTELATTAAAGRSARSTRCGPAAATGGVFVSRDRCTTRRARQSDVPEAISASLGCGVPTAVADLHEGETVLDLGSGAGADVLISARRVGPTGKAIGLDMTDEMLELARRNAADAGIENVEFSRATSRTCRSPTRASTS